MAKDQEPVLKTESALTEVMLNERKLRIDKQPVGTLILTNKQLLFAPAHHGGLKGSLAILLVGKWGAKKVTNVAYSKHEEAMHREGSLMIPLSSIIDIHSFRTKGLVTGPPHLLLKWKDERGDENSAVILRNTKKDFLDWEEAVKAQQIVVQRAPPPP